MQRRFASVEEITAHVTLVFRLRALAFCKAVSSTHGIGADAIQTHLRLGFARLEVTFLHPAWALVVGEAAKVSAAGGESALIPRTANVVGTPVATSHWVTTWTCNFQAQITSQYIERHNRPFPLLQRLLGNYTLEKFITTDGTEEHYKFNRIVKFGYKML